MSSDWEDWRDGFPAEVWKAQLGKELAETTPVPLKEAPAQRVQPSAAPLNQPAPSKQRQTRKDYKPKPIHSAGKLNVGCFTKVGFQEHNGDTIHLFRHKTNKLRVVLAPKSSNNVSALSVCFLVGSKAETLGTTGSGKASTRVFNANFCIDLTFS